MIEVDFYIDHEYDSKRRKYVERLFAFRDGQPYRVALTRIKELYGEGPKGMDGASIMMSESDWRYLRPVKAKVASGPSETGHIYNPGRRRNGKMTYTDAELLDYLKTAKSGITVMELAYSFGGTSSSHTARLRKLVKAGKIKTRKVGKTTRYYRANPRSRKNPEFGAWLRSADNYLQDYGFGHEEFPESEWEKLYDQGASWQDAVEYLTDKYGYSINPRRRKNPRVGHYVVYVSDSGTSRGRVVGTIVFAPDPYGYAETPQSLARNVYGHLRKTARSRIRVKHEDEASEKDFELARDREWKNRNLNNPAYRTR